MSDEVTRPGIVIVGPPRSGTTLLRRLLDAHPDIASPPETYLLSAAARFLHDDRFAAGLQIGVLSGLAFAGFEESEVLDRLRRFVFGFFEEHAARSNKRRWAEKTAFDAFHLPAIRKLCEGHVQFVCIQRHGLDATASLKELVDKTGGYVDELRPYLQAHPEPLRALAHAWVDAANAVADVADAGGIAVKYESLVDDPAAVVGELLAALGERADADTVDEVLTRALSEEGKLGFGDWKTYGRAKIDATSIGRWQSLPPPVQDQLAAICNPTLQRLGYAEVDIQGATEDAATARRRYEFGLRVNRMKTQREE